MDSKPSLLEDENLKKSEKLGVYLSGIAKTSGSVEFFTRLV